MFKNLKKELGIDVKPKGSNFTIPRDPQKFYEDFGFLQHPSLRDEKGRPLLVSRLTDYQIKAWKYPGNLLVIKSNKVGMTTSFSLEDFHSRLLPETAGYDVLLVGQTQQMADEHIRDLKKLIRNSKKYSRFLIEQPDNELMREETSKSSIAYIRNPYSSKKPSRIIGIGNSEATAYSWKNVNHIHMSDAALLPVTDQKEFFGALYSRLANTNGIVKIETIPNGQQGEIWNIYNKSKKQTHRDFVGLVEDPEQMASKFKVMEVFADEAVAAGLITQEFLDQEKRELGDLLYQQFYGCKFVAPGNQWYKPEWIHRENYIVGM